MPIERVYCVPIDESNALNCARDPSARVEDMVSMYADCIISEAKARERGSSDRVDWASLNRAISERWSLLRIKKLAWKKIDGGKQ